MDDIKKERLVIVISSLAGIACIIQNVICGWEFWVPAVIAAVTAALWFFHFSSKTSSGIRVNI